MAPASDQPWENLTDGTKVLGEDEIADVRQTLLGPEGSLESDWLWRCVVNQLREGVFHVTSFEAWTAIASTRQLVTNLGDRQPSFPKSQHCRGWSNKGVCLFDFESACIEIVARQWDWCARHVFESYSRSTRECNDPVETMVRFLDPDSVEPKRPPVIVVQFANRSVLPGPWEYWHPKQEPTDDSIPYVECWHLSPMHLKYSTTIHSIALESETWKRYTPREALSNLSRCNASDGIGVIRHFG